MCGFAGVISWDHRYRTSRETLARMSAAVAHRGPDGEGLYINHEQEITPDNPQVALAHRRLAIIDPDPRANQPFTDGHGNWIVYNGEIYNFRELKKELSSLDPQYQWKTNCDTEVLLRAYAQWAENCCEKLNGMFAFAVWDEQKRQLFLARDRMGQKPLYVACIAANGHPTQPQFPWHRDEHVLPPRVIVFASEIQAVLSRNIASTAFDEGALTGYLHFGFLGPGETIYTGIREVRPAVQVIARLNSCEASMYWPGTDYPLTDPILRTDSDAVRLTRELVTTAVRRQLVADVPLGCHLSGGIDSSIIAASMKLLAGKGQHVLTFSVGFDDPRYDESAHAKEVAEHLGTKHRSFIVRPNVVEDLPRLAAAFGQPFADSSALPTHYLARETRPYVKVALSGDGGDELFAGYDRYRAMKVAQKLRRLTTPIPWLLMTPLLRLTPQGHPKAPFTRARRFLTSVREPSDRRYATYLRLFDGDTIQELTRGKLNCSPTHNDFVYFLFGHAHLNFAVGGGSPEERIRDEVRAALAIDRFHYLPGDLLTKVDRASMLHALEVRSPFMDHELVTFAAGLTTKQLLKGGPKRMLREAFAADLPDFVFKRKKMGFAVPIGDWLRTSLRPMLHDHLFAADSFATTHFNLPVVRRLVDEHEQQRVDHSQRLYALLMLELWWSIHRSRSGLP